MTKIIHISGQDITGINDNIYEDVDLEDYYDEKLLYTNRDLLVVTEEVRSNAYQKGFNIGLGWRLTIAVTAISNTIFINS